MVKEKTVIKIMLEVLLVLYVLLPSSNCACTLPSELDGVWWDSRINGPFTISSQQVTTGWNVKILEVFFTTYDCVESDDSHWVFKSINSENIFGPISHVTFCLQYTKLTDNSFKYHLQGNENDQATADGIDGSPRLFLATAGETYSISEYCNPSPGLESSEFNVLVKLNTQDTVHNERYFPDSLLGVFRVTISDGGSGGISCGSEAVWDGCYINSVLDRTAVTLNNTQCNSNLMGSTNGKFYHVESVTSGDTDYVILINADGTDNSDNLFTCIAVTATGNTRSVSTHPGGCAKGQVSTATTSHTDSVLITLTASETCLFTTPTESGSTDGGGSNTAAIVGSIMAILLLIAIIVIAFLVYQKYFKRRRPHVTNQSFKDQSIDIKAPLPNGSGFTLSDPDLSRNKEPVVENDMVVEPLTPRDKPAIAMNDVLSGNMSPIPEHARPPTSSFFRKSTVTSEDHMRRNLTPLPEKSRVPSSSVTRSAKPLPPISGHT